MILYQAFLLFGDLLPNVPEVSFWFSLLIGTSVAFAPYPFILTLSMVNLCIV